MVTISHDWWVVIHSSEWSMSSVTGNFHPGNRLLIFFCYLTEKEDEVICGGFVGFFTKFFSKKIIDCILFFCWSYVLEL